MAVDYLPKLLEWAQEFLQPGVAGVVDDNRLDRHGLRYSSPGGPSDRYVLIQALTGEGPARSPRAYTVNLIGRQGDQDMVIRQSFWSVGKSAGKVVRVQHPTFLAIWAFYPPNDQSARHVKIFFPGDKKLYVATGRAVLEERLPRSPSFRRVEQYAVEVLKTETDRLFKIKPTAMLKKLLRGCGLEMTAEVDWLVIRTGKMGHGTNHLRDFRGVQVGFEMAERLGLAVAPPAASAEYSFLLGIGRDQIRRFGGLAAGAAILVAGVSLALLLRLRSGENIA